MSTTELNIGLTSSTRPSSRVLKPPGGGHTNIFTEPEVAQPQVRPKYNQQNSSNLNACMGSTDPNKIVEKLREEIAAPKEELSKGNSASQQNKSNAGDKSANSANESSRGRVPPGGYSSGGFW